MDSNDNFTGGVRENDDASVLVFVQDGKWLYEVTLQGFSDAYTPLRGKTLYLTKAEAYEAGQTALRGLLAHQVLEEK